MHKINNHENITIINNDDKQFKTVKESIVDKDLNRKSIRFITVEDVHPIVIVFSAPLNEFDKFQLIFNKMMNSIKLY